MSRTKSATNRDNNVSHRSREQLDIRAAAEIDLSSQTRNLACPAYLTDEAKKEWARIVSIDNSRKNKIIYDSDSAALEMLCELRSAWIRCQANWTAACGITRSTRDEIIECIELEKDIYAELRKLSKEAELQYSKFGLTPLGRAKLAVAGAKDANKENEEDGFFD